MSYISKWRAIAFQLYFRVRY